MAWLIVGSGALLTLALLGAIGWWASGHVADWAREAAKPQPRYDLDAPLPVPAQVGPPPSNSATPAFDIVDLLGPEDYPPGPLRRGETGRVRVTLSIDPSGTPTGCSVHLSSGYPGLDNGTCLLFMREARFDRAPRKEFGQRRWTTPPIRWALPE